MDGLKSIAFETDPDDDMLLSASGFHIDPLRVLLMTEADCFLAMKSGRSTSYSRAMPILSTEAPTIRLKMPTAGKWRIVYRPADANVVTVNVVRMT